MEPRSLWWTLTPTPCCRQYLTNSRCIQAGSLQLRENLENLEKLGSLKQLWENIENSANFPLFYQNSRKTRELYYLPSIIWFISIEFFFQDALSFYYSNMRFMIEKEKRCWMTLVNIKAQLFVYFKLWLNMATGIVYFATYVFNYSIIPITRTPDNSNSR